MDDAMTTVFSYLSPREVRKCERVSRTWRRLTHRALRQLDDVDFERDFAGAITDPARMERILRKH